MKTLITGVGSCGTTFLARLFMELGCDLGDELNAVERPRGMEHLPLAQFLTDWDMMYSPYPLPAYGTEHGTIRGAPIDDFFQFRDQTWTTQPASGHNTGLPEVVKSPLMPHWLHTWLRAGGTRPEVVIVCTRPLQDTAKSFTHEVDWLEYYSLYAWQAMRYGLLWDTLQQEQQHIESIVIEYPRMVHDVEYLHDILYGMRATVGRMKHFEKDHRTIAKPSLVGYYGDS